MRSGLKEAQILLVLGISLWILVLPAYQHSYGLEEGDISFLYLNLENPNGDGLGINLDGEAARETLDILREMTEASE
jgi:hypothetical protein